jgi:DNA polymerase III delta subunit
MPSQLFLFTGENTFTLQEELSRWKKNFLEKHGEANFQVVSGKELKWSDLLDETRATPFLGEKRLIIIEGLPSKVTKEELELLVNEMHPSSLVAFVDPKPDKRKSSTKFLIKHAEVKSFNLLTPKQLVSWLIALAQDHEVSLLPDVAAHLVARVGSDQWHLKQEVLKLFAYAESNSPTREDVDVVSLPSQKHTIWILSDMIGRGQIEEAVTFSRTLHESGEDAFSLWNIFLWIMKNMATLWIFQSEKNLPLGALSKEAGVPFPSVQSLLPALKNMNKEQMEEIVERVVAADEALKTGQIKATGGEPIELMATLEREILQISACRT